MDKSAQNNSHTASQAAQPRPPRAENRGIHETTAVLARGGAFGFGAYFLGKWLAKFFIREHGARVGNVRHFTGLTFAVFGGILGAYNASREARAGAKQLLELQQEVQTLDTENIALKETLSASTHTEPESTAAPDTTIIAGDAQEALLHPEAERSLA